MHPGPGCPRHPSGPCALISGTPSLSLPAAFGLGPPFLRDIGVARSSGARGSHGHPQAHSHPWKPATRRAGFPVSAGWWAFALEEGRTKQEVSKVRKSGVWKARPVPLSLSPASAAPPVNRRYPLLTAIRPSGPRAAGQSLLASCPRRPGSRRPLGRFSVEHTFLAAMSQKAEVRERRGRSQELRALRFKTAPPAPWKRNPLRSRKTITGSSAAASGVHAKPPQAWPRALQHSHGEASSGPPWRASG